MKDGIRFGVSSDIGRVREVQEDSLLYEPPIFAVADGMGGHSAGDVASAIAVDLLRTKSPSDPGTLVQAVNEANLAIYRKAKDDQKLRGMGTTLTALYAGEDSAAIAHVGDSRAYLLRDGEFRRLTKDHTPVGRLVEEGRLSPEDADRHPQRSYLERALGIDETVNVDVSVLDISGGDRLLLCSDGLYGMLTEDEIRGFLSETDDPQAASDALCRAAVEAGGFDNVTAIVVDYPGSPRLSDVAVAKPKQRAVRLGTRAKLWLAALILILAGGLAVAFSAVRGSWYVGAEGDRVTIFNGVKGSVAGIDLSSPKQISALHVSSLPEPEQIQVREGIEASDLGEARRILANLERVARGAG